VVGLRILDPGSRLPAPRLSGTTLAGRRFSLPDHLNGQVVLINVWASWCGPCREEMPLLARAAARRPNLLVVGIDERDSASAARSFAAAAGATYPSLSDPAGTLLNSLPLVPRTAVPSSLFIDSQGKVAAVVVGAVTRQQLDSVMAKLSRPA
jgi:thiol-disulfide isomerase/thioredoxin